MLVPRERELALPERVPLLRDDFAAPPAEDFFAVVPDDALRVVGALRVPLARLEPEEDFAREDVDEDLRVPPVARLDAERLPEDFLALPPRDDELDDEVPELPPVVSSTVHLPDMTRCAASATASAISEPSLVALDITLLAACVAVSAASRPASRMARRALGLALIAAAAAASPAASISLLIAALASLSTVSLRLLDEEPEEPLFADFAIGCSPPVWRKRHFKAVTVPERGGKRPRVRQKM